MTRNKRPDKRTRNVHQSRGHGHSPPTNSKAKRKANIQSRLAAAAKAHDAAQAVKERAKQLQFFCIVFGAPVPLKPFSIASDFAVKQHAAPRSDAPSVIATAYSKSHAIKAYVPIHGAGQGKEKPKVTPADKKRFAGEPDKHYTVDKVKSKPGQRLKTKVISRHKDQPAQYMGEYERSARSHAQGKDALPDAEYQRIKGTLGLRK